MGLDEAWCTRGLDPTSPVWQVIVKLVRVKKAGVGDHLMYGGDITTIFQNEAQLGAVLCIPGIIDSNSVFDFWRNKILTPDKFQIL